MPLTREGGSRIFLTARGDILLLQETKLFEDSYQKSMAKWSKWEYAHLYSVGVSRGCAALWSPKSVVGNLVSQGSGWQLLNFKHYDISLCVINTYSPSSSLNKKKLWDNLLSIIHSRPDHQFIIGGDFNAIQNASEKQGGIIPPAKAMEDFDSFIQANHFIDPHPSNGTFIWNNRRVSFPIAERLDMFLVSHNWKLQRFSINFVILAFPGSDHFPVQLDLFIIAPQGLLVRKLAFKFDGMWFRYLHFLPLIRQWWVSAPQVVGSRMFHKMLKYVKKQIKTWNIKVFKNIFAQKEVVKKVLELGRY